MEESIYVRQNLEKMKIVLGWNEGQFWLLLNVILVFPKEVKLEGSWFWKLQRFCECIFVRGTCILSLCDAWNTEIHV